MKINIYQIYYDDKTKQMLLPGFSPLDNSSNVRPDWFEFWVILNFLRENPLEDDAWYGFLSPRFYEKTEFSSEFVINVLKSYGANAEVALFSPDWDQLSYFLNPFEQGEMWHPGLLYHSQKFTDFLNLEVNLSKLVTDTTSSVFSNYIIAKKRFWNEWRRIAEAFFNYAENNVAFKSYVSYGSIENQYPMKTFIQERFASLILATGNFKVLSPDQSFTAPIFSRLFPQDIKTRRYLQGCDLMKKKYRETSDKKYIDMYWSLRNDIHYSNIKF
jgi:hypothetical protein